MKLYLFLMLFTVLSWLPRVKKTDLSLLCHWTSQVAQVVKNSPDNAGDKRDTGLIPGLGRSPGAANSNPLQYSCLENPKDRRAWRVTVHGVTKSWTQLKQLRSSIMPLITFNIFLQSNVLEINFLVYYNIISASLYCCCSVCPTPWDPMDCSTPGFPGLYHVLELAQTRVHWVDDAIQPAHLLSSSSPAFSPSQHQGLF